MWYVHILRSLPFPEQEYTGATANLKQRIANHNTGRSQHTAKYAPWQLMWYCAFSNKITALEFENISSRIQAEHSPKRG